MCYQKLAILMKKGTVVPNLEAEKTVFGAKAGRGAPKTAEQTFSLRFTGSHETRGVH